jgi:hypothetical protein
MDGSERELCSAVHMVGCMKWYAALRHARPQTTH